MVLMVLRFVDVAQLGTRSIFEFRVMSRFGSWGHTSRQCHSKVGPGTTPTGPRREASRTHSTSRPAPGYEQGRKGRPLTIFSFPNGKSMEIHYLGNLYMENVFPIWGFLFRKSKLWHINILSPGVLMWGRVEKSTVYRCFFSYFFIFYHSNAHLWFSNVWLAVGFWVFPAIPLVACFLKRPWDHQVADFGKGENVAKMPQSFSETGIQLFAA